MNKLFWTTKLILKCWCLFGVRKTLLVYSQFHWFRLLLLNQLFWVDFDHCWSELYFFGSWGSSKNWLELKIETALSNLACLNRWNTLYEKGLSSWVVWLLRIQNKFISSNQIWLCSDNSKLKTKWKPKIRRVSF
jgi:hypothetical protein